MAKKKAKPKPKTKTAAAPPSPPPLPPPPPDEVAWRKEMASELGVIPETMREWSRRPGFPLFGTLDQVVAWKLAHVRPGGPPTKGQRDGGANPFGEVSIQEVEAEKARNIFLKNEKINEDIIAKRLANEIKRRELISLPAVMDFLRKWIAADRSDIEGWPAEVITILPGNLREAAFDFWQEKVRLRLVRMAGLEYELRTNEEIMGDAAK